MYYADVTIGNFILEFEITGWVPDESGDDHNEESSEETSFMTLVPFFAAMTAITLVKRRDRTLL